MKKDKIFLSIFVGCAFSLLIVLLTGSTAFSLEDKSKVPMDLDSTEWVAETVEVIKGKKITGSDTLKFSNKKFISKNFEDKGYEPTNYSLTLEEDGTTRFGTMQVNDKETSFWKGIVKGDVIEGNVHTQFPKGTNKTVYFNGKLTSGAPKPKVKNKPKVRTPPPAPPVPTAPPVPPAAPEIQATLDVTVLPNTSENGESASSEEAVETAPVVDQESK